MSRKCSKKVAALTWALLECMFFSSVVLGWTWLAIVFRSDGYFPDYCNFTSVNITPAPDISEAGVEALRTADHRKTQRQKKPCRKARSVDRLLEDGVFPKDSLSLFDGHDDHVRRVYVDGGLRKKVDSQTQLRFKRGDTSNLSSLRTNPLSAASITQTQPEDVIQEKKDSKYSTHVREYCQNQNEQIRVMFAVVLIIRDVLTFPLGFFFDKYGTTRTRLLTV